MGFQFPKKADKATRDARRALCNAPCPHKRGPRCALCGCPLAFKIPFAGQSCPAGKW